MRIAPYRKAKIKAGKYRRSLKPATARPIKASENCGYHVNDREQFADYRLNCSNSKF
jgi:hypothetical protein